MPVPSKGYWVNQGGNMVFVGQTGPTATGGGATATAQNPPDGSAARSTALNVSAMLALADTEPERNPRNTSGEVLSNIYRELGRLRGDVSYLKQK